MRALLLLPLIVSYGSFAQGPGSSQGTGGQTNPPPKVEQQGTGPTVKGKPGKGGGAVQVDVSWQLLDGPLQQDPYVEICCDNYCVNEEKSNPDLPCDKDCDHFCDKPHRLVMKGSSKLLTDDLIKAIESLNAAAKKAGYEGRAPASQLIDAARSAVDAAVKATTMDLDLNVPHFNNERCVDRWRDYGYHKQPVMMTVKASFVADGKSADLGTQTVKVGELTVPDSNPFRDLSQLYCWCGLNLDENPYGYIYDELHSVQIQYKYLEIWKILDDPKTPAIAPVPKNETPSLKLRSIRGRGISFDRPDDKCSIDVRGVDMNSMEITITNRSNQDVYCELPPGLVFVGEDAYQKMMLTKFKRILVAKALSAPGHGPSEEVVTPTVATFKVDAVCIEMAKKAPTPGLAYKPVRDAQDGLVNLAKSVGRQAVSGVGDQAKVWILTDHATFPQCQERLLFPKITSGQYLNGLYDVSRLGCVDILSDAFKPCVTPDLVLGGDAYEGPTRWLVSTFQKTDPGALAAVVTGSLDSLRKDLAYESRPKMKQHVADLALALEESTDTRLQNAVLALLESIPETDRATIARLGGFRSFALLIASKDDAVVSKAVAVEKLYEPALASTPIGPGLKALAEERAAS